MQSSCKTFCSFARHVDVISLVNKLRLLLQDWRFRAAASIVLAAFLMFFMSLQDRYGYTDDDWAISVVLSGRYPDSGLCLFVNAAISHLCLFFNEAFPFLNWFIFLEGVATFIAFAAFCYAMLTYVTPLIALIAIAAVQYFMMPSCTYLANFTFITALCTLSGAALLLGRLSLPKTKKAYFSAALGILLCVVGFCLRREAFYLGLPFFFVVLVLFLVQERNKKDVLRRCIPIGILFALCAVLYVYNEWAWSSPEWAQWAQYNSLRAQMSDYGMPPYEDVKDTLAAAGINEAAYSLALNWGTGISDFFSMDRMETLASLSYGRNSSGLTSAFTAYPLSLSTNARIVCFFIGVLFLCCVLAKRWGRVAIVTAALIAYVACSYFFGIGRLIDRVEVPIYMYALLCCAFGVGRVWKLPRMHPYSQKSLLVSAAFASVGCIFVLALTLHMMQHLIAHFDPKQAAYAVQQEDFTPSSDRLYSFAMKSDTTNVWDTNSYVVLSTAYEHRFLPSINFLRKNVTIGGWGTHAPFTAALNKDVGLQNMVEGMVNNPKVHFVTDNKGLAKTVLTFIQSYYYPDAQLQVVELFCDPGYDSIFYSYEIRSASGK